ncbi:YitT family protein [Desulfobacter sp.]|uniref:YitT family protein n=1 Tax=Desulfobacter sp. TaxID=2294 RepID=UPI003D11723B
MTRKNMKEAVKQKLESPGWQKILRISNQQLAITLGAVLNAFAYVLFQMPYNLAAGGVAGLGIIVNTLTGFSPGLFYFTANIPLFILGFFTLGKWRFLFTSTLAVVVFSGATEFFIIHMPTVFTRFPITENKLLATIYCGLLIGIGSGIIYRFGGTIGGTSIITRIIYNKTGFPMSQSGLYVDVIIIAAAGLVFNWETSLLAFLALLIAGMSADFALEGASQMRTLIIITQNPEPLRYAIINELKRGVTMWQVNGGYSGEERTLLYLTVLRSRVYDVKFIINRIDPDAFMVVGVSQQTWGGYTLKKKVQAIASDHDADL